MKATSDSAILDSALKDLGKGALAAGLIGFFVNILYLAMPLYSIQIYDRVISSGSIDTLIALSGLVLVMIAFMMILDFLRGRILAILGARLQARLGSAVFEAAVETTLRDGATVAGGAIRDLNDLRNFVSGGRFTLPMDLAMAPIMLFALFLMNRVYGLIGLGAVLVLTSMALATEFLVRRPSRLSTRAMGKVQAETSGAMRNADAITAMGMLPDMTRRWQAAQTEALALGDGKSAVSKALAALARGLRMAMQIAIIAAGATLVIDRLATAGTIIAAAVILSRLLLPFEQLIDGWKQWVDAFAALERLREVLTRGETTRSHTPVDIAEGRLVVDRLGYVPAGTERPVLRNITFRLDPGEMLGVVGASGAGKSSLARMIVGLAQPTTGGVYINGQSAFAHERGSFGAAIGYLPQEPMLFDASVRDNIARFRETPMADVVEAARIAGIHDLIGRLPRGYETRLTDSGRWLSGGQKQRLALARAVFGTPQLIVLDEPNSSLDAEGEAALIAAIEVMRDRGVTLVVIAQRMSILKRADRLLSIKDGAMLQFGGRAEVMAAIGGPIQRPRLPPAKAQRA